jgi:hypothetical protein
MEGYWIYSFISCYTGICVGSRLLQVKIFTALEHATMRFEHAADRHEQTHLTRRRATPDVTYHNHIPRTRAWCNNESNHTITNGSLSRSDIHKHPNPPWTRSSNPSNQPQQPKQNPQPNDLTPTNPTPTKSRKNAASHVPSETSTPPPAQATKSPKVPAKQPPISTPATPS